MMWLIYNLIIDGLTDSRGRSSRTRKSETGGRDNAQTKTLVGLCFEQSFCASRTHPHEEMHMMHCYVMKRTKQAQIHLETKVTLRATMKGRLRKCVTKSF